MPRARLPRRPRLLLRPRLGPKRPRPSSRRQLHVGAGRLADRSDDLDFTLGEKAELERQIEDLKPWFGATTPARIAGGIALVVGGGWRAGQYVKSVGDAGKSAASSLLKGQHTPTPARAFSKTPIAICALGAGLIAGAQIGDTLRHRF